MLDNHPDPQPIHRLRQRGSVIARWVGQAGWIERVVAGDRPEQDRRVGDGARQWAGVVE
jgi:hypothetical protein